MVSRGDRVKIQGFRGKTGELIVWESRDQGLLLCTEQGYRLLLQGIEAPIVGFPMCDIMGLA